MFSLAFFKSLIVPLEQIRNAEVIYCTFDVWHIPTLSVIPENLCLLNNCKVCFSLPFSTFYYDKTPLFSLRAAPTISSLLVYQLFIPCIKPSHHTSSWYCSQNDLFKTKFDSINISRITSLGLKDTNLNSLCSLKNKYF